MQEFCGTLLHFGLIDLGYHGNIFTWNNGRVSDDFVQARLDRASANIGWRDLFPYGRVTHIQSSYSEYTPLVITTHHPNQLVQKKKISRRFEEKWASHQECKDIIRHAWENATPTGSPMFYLFEKIIRLAFIGWPRTAFGNAKTKLQDKHKALDDLVSSNRPNNLATIKKLKGKINELLYQKELFWRQWSRSIWLKAGNKNTRYFHQRVSQRHQKNHISGIFDAHETWCTSGDDISTIAEDYLQQLFSAIATNNMEMVLASLDRFVTLVMNSTLLQDYTAEEVKHALFQMHPSKSPSPDDMSPFFFQKYWHIMGQDVTKAVLSALCSF